MSTSNSTPDSEHSHSTPHPHSQQLDTLDATRFISQCGYIYRHESQISQSLLCPICSEPWVEPLLASFCGHLFCKACIHTWIKHIPTCPVDRLPLSPSRLTQPPKIINELVEELYVICSLGCGWEGRRDGWKDHLERYCPESRNDEGQGLMKTNVVIRNPSPSSSSHQVEDRDDEEQKFESRWKHLAREVTVLKKQAKEYHETIEMWKDKVEKLQLELRKAIEVAPVPAPTTPIRADPPESSSLPTHRATCDFCRVHIRGIRYKCLKCPDLDSCQTCYAKIAYHHPIHDFVPIKDPADVNVISLPEWKIEHSRVTCNHCGFKVVGPRYKCTLCADYDLCHLCFALPRPPHPLHHPMTRYVHPQR